MNPSGDGEIISSGDRDHCQLWAGCDGKGEVRALIIWLVTFDNKEGGATIVASIINVCAIVKCPVFVIYIMLLVVRVLCGL